ncbi:MAG: sodium ion-translocating decarboxylase subunit beta [Phycisphaerales bacterium]|nr:sodium ion-translocating decarboxylase subunit beta [Phycisphaerales bacterium]
MDTLTNYLINSGFGQFHWTNGVMILIGFLFIFLAVKKGFEPLLLVPIGFGILIGNIPYDASTLPLSVYDGPVSQHDIAYYEVRIGEVVLRAGDEALTLDEALNELGIDAELFNHERMMSLIYASQRVSFDSVERIDSHLEATRLLEEGRAVMVNMHSVLAARRDVAEQSVVNYGQGRRLFINDLADDNRYPELWSVVKQDPHNASVFWWLFAGVGLAGFYPPLIFLGIGALTDFGPMLSNPKTLLLGAAAQFGIFGSLLGALALGFDLKEAASIGIIGGADGPTAIFTCSRLAPDLLGAVALAAYSYMALVPIIQPPIIKLLTTREERLIRMTETKQVSKRVKVVFPIVAFLLTAFVAPGGLPLLGMLFFGNLLRESLVTDRLSKTASGTFIDIVTILLGVTVGAKTSAPNFLTLQTIFIFILGITAFGVATATGVLFGKLMSRFSKEPLNPMIGAAGVSAVPMAARVVHRLGLDEDPHNFLLMHAMGPNVAGVIGSAVAAGVLLSRLAGT